MNRLYYLIIYIYYYKYIKNIMTKCKQCNKKCGLLGYICKGCNNEYCTIHRLPEEHCCVNLDKIKSDSKDTLRMTLIKDKEDLQECAKRNNYIRM
jgi:predicted nucleic acid binding AN1-type Zn finger protein